MNQRLLPFYFGAVSVEERLALEREMLTNAETLLDYLDLKRELEAAPAVPSVPSPALFRRLYAKTRTSRRVRVSLALGLTVAAACLALTFFRGEKPRPRESATSTSGVLFDSGHEQFGLSNVL